MLFRSNFRKPDVPDLALLLQVTEGAGTFFDRDILVPAVEIVEIDDIGLKVGEAFFAGLDDGLWASVDASLAVFVDDDSTLAREHELIAALLEHVADELFVVPETVDARGVEKRVSDLECVKQRALGFFGVGLAVGLGHTHAADPDGGDLEAAKHSLLHLILPVERVALNWGCYRNRLAVEIASGTLG